MWLLVQRSFKMAGTYKKEKDGFLHLLDIKMPVYCFEFWDESDNPKRANDFSR
jgi:hypothetical protein